MVGSNKESSKGTFLTRPSLGKNKNVNRVFSLLDLDAVYSFGVSYIFLKNAAQIILKKSPYEKQESVLLVEEGIYPPRFNAGKTVNLLHLPCNNRTCLAV